MENIRIWSKETKQSEAVWLGYLLTLCGWQIWRGRLIDDSLSQICANEEYQYVDILLFDSVDADFCEKLAIMHPKGAVCISGDGWHQLRELRWEFCPQLDVADVSTLLMIMDRLCNFLTRDINEREGILKLSSSYVAEKSALSKSIYTTHELFCSRRVNYEEYENRGLLKDALAQMERWYRGYAMSNYKKKAFSEEFALTYMQNMIDDAYIKAHVRGGFDTSIIFRNANYLLKRNPRSMPVWFLKLQILRNCINYEEWPDEVLAKYVSGSAPEYRGRAYCEIGDISRENPNKIFDFSSEEYFEKADDENPEEYCGLYKLGYLYEKKADKGCHWLDEAEVKYTQVIEYISRITPNYRTPREFEYYYKASYGKLKSQIERDRICGQLSDGKILYYEEKLNDLIMGTGNFAKLDFWGKFYETGEERNKTLSFMQEKMEHIEGSVRQLLNDKVRALKN